MKQRVITGLIGGPLALIAICLRNTIFFNIIVMIATVIAVYEVLKSTKYVRSNAIFITCLVYALASAYFMLLGFHLSLLCTLLYVLALFAIILKQYKTVQLKEISFGFMMTLMVSLSFVLLTIFARGTVIYPETYAGADGVFLLILAIGGAWFCDIGAYFAGTFFGKNKMAPGISPKKTWEGAIGGVASNIVLCLFVGLIWKIFFLSTAEHIQWLLLTLYALISAVGSMFGDLVFSVIKRKCNIKDYGNIIPGHGGVLDRFDSVILTAPILYMFIQVFPLIIR